MTSQEIIRLLDILIGNTNATGDSDADIAVKGNVAQLIDITNWCLDGLLWSAKTRHNVEASMRDIGETAFSAICDYADWCRRAIDED